MVTIETEPASDEELTALALAADPDAPLAADAVSFWSLGADDVDDDAPLLPGWYMPAPMPGARRLTGWRRRVAISVVVSFVLIDAAGLCSTYGSLVIA
jgi:hypothetical protein